jgi:hypothetical protein
VGARTGEGTHDGAATCLDSLRSLDRWARCGIEKGGGEKRNDARVDERERESRRPVLFICECRAAVRCEARAVVDRIECPAQIGDIFSQPRPVMELVSWEHLCSRMGREPKGLCVEFT